MQDVQMLRTEINRGLSFLSLENLRLVAQYIASLYTGNRNEENELDIPESAQKHHVNYPITNPIGYEITKTNLDAWFAKCDIFFEQVLTRRNGESVDISDIWESVEADLEEHDNRIFSA